MLFAVNAQTASSTITYPTPHTPHPSPSFRFRRIRYSNKRLFDFLKGALWLAASDSYAVHRVGTRETLRWRGSAVFWISFAGKRNFREDHRNIVVYCPKAGGKTRETLRVAAAQHGGNAHLFRFHESFCLVGKKSLVWKCPLCGTCAWCRELSGRRSKARGSAEKG